MRSWNLNCIFGFSFYSFISSAFKWGVRLVLHFGVRMPLCLVFVILSLRSAIGFKCLLNLLLNLVCDLSRVVANLNAFQFARRRHLRRGGSVQGWQCSTWFETCFVCMLSLVAIMVVGLFRLVWLLLSMFVFVRLWADWIEVVVLICFAHLGRYIC